MRPVHLSVAWIIASALATAATPAAPADPKPGHATRADPLLRADPRLRAKLKRQAVDTSRGALRGEAGQRRGARLAASGEARHDNATTVMERPAAEALGLLAKHLDFTWVR